GVLSPTGPASYQPSSEANSGWGIQVGAYTDPRTAQEALTRTQTQLGGLPSSARGAIVPAQTANGTVYRVRILGLNAQAANQACAKLNECMIFTLR
ncbi:MAG TPA: SPOR domain-containing protein, partial [Alphaproteobacteria bacterium]